MISPGYYTENNTVKLYNKGKAAHYLAKERIIISGFSTRTVQHGETLYSIAENLFGTEGKHLWTIIADINILKMPDEWEAGDEIKIPVIVVNESETSQNIAIRDRINKGLSIVST